MYGETEELKAIAKNELDTYLNSEKFTNLFGVKSIDVKNGAYADIEFYKAKRAIDVNAEDGLAAAKKNKLINLENYEKLKAYAGKNKITNSETSKEVLKGMEKQLNDFTVPDITTLNNIIENAKATGDNTTLQKAQNILIEGNVLLILKQ